MKTISKLKKKTKILIALSATATTLVAVGTGITITYSKNKDYYYKKQSMEIFKSDEYFLSGQLKELVNGVKGNHATRIYIKSPTNVSILAGRLFEYRVQTIIGIKGDGLLNALKFGLDNNKDDINSVSPQFNVIFQNSPDGSIDDFNQLKNGHEKGDLGIYQANFRNSPAIQLENSYGDNHENMSLGLNMDGLPDGLGSNKKKFIDDFDKLDSISISGVESRINSNTSGDLRYRTDEAGYMINFAVVEQLKFNFSDGAILTGDRT